MTASVAQSTTAAIVALWRRVNPYDGDEVAAFAKRAGRLLVPAQRTVANVHVAAQQKQLQAMGVNHRVTVNIPDNVRGQTVKFGKMPKVVAPETTTLTYQAPPDAEPPVDLDAPPEGAERTVSKTDADADKIMKRAAEAYRYEKSIGSDEDKANAAAEQRIERIVEDNMMLAGRMAAQQTLKLVDDEAGTIVGYRRVIHPELSKGGVCGLCVVAADRWYKIETLQPIHARCECTIAPIVRKGNDLLDPGADLYQVDLDQLYEDASEVAPMEDIVDRRTGEVIGTRKALGTSAKALKKTRYVIVDHHELGPVLTRVTGEKVPYFTKQEAVA